MLLNAGQRKMEKLFLCISITFILSGCAQLDQAGEYVLKEVRSINVDNPESHEESRTLADSWGEDVEADKETLRSESSLSEGIRGG